MIDAVVRMIAAGVLLSGQAALSNTGTVDELLDAKRGVEPAYLADFGVIEFQTRSLIRLATFVSQGAGRADTVMLVNVKTRKCMTIAGGRNAANNIPTVQYDCDYDPSRRWTMSEVEPGRFQIRNVQTGKCLTIAGGRSTANNITALQYECDADPSRQWVLSAMGGDIYQIVNAQTGKCLTIAGGTSSANNLEGVQFDCDDDLSRRWTVRPTR